MYAAWHFLWSVFSGGAEHVLFGGTGAFSNRMIRGAGDAVEFVGGAFGGEVVVGLFGPDGEGTLHFE